MTAPWKGLDPDPLYVPEKPPMKRVLMSTELFEMLGASRVDWGEPDADGFYTPTVYREHDDFAKSRMLGGYLVAAAIVGLAIIAIVLLAGRGS